MIFTKVTVKIHDDESKIGRGFGRGIVELLEGVERTGSLNKAASDMHMAYSKAWRIIKQTEEEFNITLMERLGPKGSSLTEEAQYFMTHYREMLQAAENAANDVFREHFEDYIRQKKNAAKK